MTVTIYHHKISVCSEKVRMVLREKGATDWDSRELNPRKSEQLSPAYLAINPKGVVPTLVDANGILPESTLIADYLDDLYPAPPLKPADAFARARMRLFPKACDEGLHQGVAVISFSGVFMERLRATWGDTLDARLDRIIDLERRDRQKAVAAHGADAPHVYRGVAAFETAFKMAERSLDAFGGPWLMGGQFTLADINMAPYVARLDHMGLLDLWLMRRPGVARWFERLSVRPSYIAEITDCTAADELADFKAGGARIRHRIAAHLDRYLAHDPAAQFA